MPKPKRVALYARVSTHERTGDRPGGADCRAQNPETQLRQLREYAERRAFEVVGEYVDIASGRSEDRPEYKRLLGDARRRRLDVVLVWRYDRFARSTQALIGALKEFQALGVDFISYQENVDTTTPQGEMVYGFLASIAQFESALISERVKAGMARAKAEGKRVSRPRIPQATQRESFTVETTLSGHGYARSIPKWRAGGYYVTLIFLALPDVETAIARVAERVRQGGHNIPAPTIRRRFEAGLDNFETIFKPLVDEWLLIDNAGDAPTLLDRFTP